MMIPRCVPCNLSFETEAGLREHKQGSPSHAFDCRSCDRHYSNERARKQHVRDSPAHASSFNCDDCDRSFNSEVALQQHLRDSPAHAPSFDCEACNQPFNDEEALRQHLQDPHAHQVADPETPLDAFFHSFAAFDYDASLPPATSYANLQRQQGWSRGSAASSDAWTRYQDALQSELRLWYGAEDDLSAWHALCRPIGIEPLPDTCKLCEKAARKTHVNIIDLIDWGRRGSEGRVRTFRSVMALRSYTLKTRKIFSNTLGQEEDGNVVLRHLLRKIF